MMPSLPSMTRQPFRPVGVGKDREPSRQPVPAPLDLRGLDPDEAGLNRMNFHGAISLIAA
jgi:hypothetical protein